MSRRRRTAGVVGVVVALGLVAAACTSTSGSAAPPGSTGSGGATATASFTVSPGVEQVTVTNAKPQTDLTLVDKAGTRLITLVSDDKGQASFALVPSQYLRFETGKGNTLPTTDGTVLKPGEGYTIVDDSASPKTTSAPFKVLAKGDTPDPSFYGKQQLKGVPWSVTGKPSDGHTVDEGVNYIATRDGTTMSAMIRFPEKAIYGDGPYPTLIEYSGYDPSNPESPQPGTRIAHALGFATVGINMRGTGCSGGVFDVFNPAQQADGYDVVETVARQPWVLHNKVGMVGLSYSGITQLYVGATKPPSLAAIAPLSVIEDPWKMSWPGGIYNAGFTKQWLAERDREAKADGQGWAQKRVKAGDKKCADNQSLRSQNIDFEKFSKSLEFRPKDTDNRDLSKLVQDISVPVYLNGGWQDEQTGPRFATMLDKFTGTNDKKFVLYNGHHPDGYSPYNISRWYEFQSIYVAQKVPRMPAIIRAGLQPEIGKAFGDENLQLQPDRYAALADDDLAGAKKIWESDPTVKVLFEWGTGVKDVPGATEPGFTAGFSSWPPPNLQPWTLYFDGDGKLGTQKPSSSGADSYTYDAAAGPIGYAAAEAYDFQAPTVKANWTNAPDGKGLSYVTEPLAQDTVIAGPGYADLWFKADQDDADIEVVLSEITPDGKEFRIQNGLLRAGDRKVDESRSNQFLIQQTFDKADYQKLPHGELTEVKVPIFPVADPLRKGSRLRVQINTPGRDLPLWFFETSSYGNDNAKYVVARGGDKASSVVLPILPAGTVQIPADRPPCPSLRGQVCRPYEPTTNQPG
jgi:predicted acyl esterase